MTKIDVYSGFLGAGKTTLIKKMIKEAYVGEKLVLIENEFGDIGIDGSFLQDAGIEITEMNSGCICCSLVGDFGKALQKVLVELKPDRILIEPSGVGKLSDVLRAIQDVESDDVILNLCITVVDVQKCKMYMKNFGEFFKDQIEHAACLVLSHTSKVASSKIDDSVNMLKTLNPNAIVMTTEWDALDGLAILNTIETKDNLNHTLESLKVEEHHSHHHHTTCHEEHHEHHDHHEHHEHGEHCTCGCHSHHADDVFMSWGIETTISYSKEKIETILDSFSESSEYGTILRCKGILPSTDNAWLHFDYIPGEADIREGSPSVIGRICVIGADLNIEKISELFK